MRGEQKRCIDPTLIATVTGGSSDSYTDTTADATVAYTYTVEPYYSSPAPTALDGSGTSASGTGASASGDDATGDVGGFSTSLSGDAVTLNWTYQGGATFEIEEKDQNDPGTNYSYLESSTGRSATISGLNPGDDYDLRIRADRSDGTVSDYVDTSANVPAAPAGDSDETLTPPSGISDPQPDSPLLPAYWSGTVDGSTDDYDSPDYTEDIGVISDQDNPLHIELPFNDASECSFGPTYPSTGPDTFTLDMDGSSGDTYTVGAYFHTGSSAQYPPEGEEYSPLAGSVSITMGGTKAPPLTLTVGQPDVSGNPTVSWQSPDGIDVDEVSFYRLVTSGGTPTAVPVTASINYDNGTAALQALPLGKSTVFALYFGEDATGEVTGFSPYSNDVTVTPTPATPAVPANLTVTTDPKYVKTINIYWQNSSNNEDHFELQKSRDSTFSTDVTTITCEHDKPSYTDTVDGKFTYYYRVRAVNSAGVPSAWSDVKHVDPPPIIVEFYGLDTPFMFPNGRGKVGSDADGNKEMTNIYNKISSAGYQIRWFFSTDVNGAFNWLLSQLDTNGDGKYDPGSALTDDQPRQIEFLGWSWGATSAAIVTHKIQRSSKFTAKQVSTVFDIDPVGTLRPGDHSIWSNVQTFINYYQDNPNGGIGIQIILPNIEGHYVNSAAPNTSETDLYPSYPLKVDHFSIVRYVEPLVYPALLGGRHL